MKNLVISIIKATGLPIETENNLGLKVRGEFKGINVIISAYHRHQTVAIASPYFRGYREFSYEEVVRKYGNYRNAGLN